MSRAIILQHVTYAGPGRIVPVFRDYGIPVDVRHLYRGDEVPTDLDELRMLVVLGGPMGVKDVGSEEFPYLAKEVNTLKRMIAVDRPVLGIALGAQLLAHAAGAKVYPNGKPGAKPEDPATPMPEYGWCPVSFPFPGGTEPIVYGMSDGVHFFQWHSDTFDLPKLPAPPNPVPGAPPPPTGHALLASSRACKNQAFRFKNRLFGFQFHFELGADEIAQMVKNDRDAAMGALGPEAERMILDDTEKYFRRYERLGRRLLDNFVQYLKTY